MKRASKFAIAAVVLIFMSALIGVLVYKPKPPVIALPNPNGYDDFVEATKVFVGVSDWPPLDLDQLRDAVAQNTNALALVRNGLKKQCRVVIEYQEGSETNYLPRLAEFKGLAHAFVTEGKLAEKEGRPNEATRSYLECVRYGEESVRGGLLIDKLVGVACEAIGMEQLRQLLPTLGPADLGKLQQGLAGLHRHPEPAESFIKQDRFWGRRRYGAFRSIMAHLAMAKSLRQSELRFREKCDRSETAVRLMRTDVAVRLYHLEKGSYPAKLEELVPQFLDSMPIDLFSERPLMYKPQTNSYLLYSVGPDRKDDGGLSYRRAGGGKGDFTSTEP
ncbi:MAG: hypothetical protein DME26_22285 [Verrucomicrobia bacterium]|nr:MAG: hypothetical protein DME26_22285 [Verrucomicrobiota bacterium]